MKREMGRNSSSSSALARSTNSDFKRWTAPDGNILEGPTPRPRGRDSWMQSILARVDKFHPESEPAQRPTVVLDRRPASRSVSLEYIRPDPTMFGNIGVGENVHVNFLAVAMKERRMQKREQVEKTMRMLEEARRKKEKERLIAERERMKEEMRRQGGRASQTGPNSSIPNNKGMQDHLPLELLPSMHPSHLEFRGLHPLYGCAKVEGSLPNGSIHSRKVGRRRGSKDHFQNRSQYGHLYDKPASAFHDTYKLIRERNGTPVPKSIMGATAEQGTHSSRLRLNNRRKRYSQILLEDTFAGKALLQPLPGSTPPLSRAESRPVTMRRSRSGQVGIFNPDTMEQMVPSIQYNRPDDYLTLASDEVVRQRSVSRVQLAATSLRSRTLSDIYQQSADEEDLSKDEDLRFLTASIFS